MPDLTHTDEPHEYRLDGVVIPSVTQVLSEVGLVDVSGPWFTDEVRARGTNVHLITELHDRGELCEEQVPLELMGYLNAWKRFKADAGFVCELVEHHVYHAVYHYAGTLDRVGTCDDGNGPQMLLDIKCGAHMPAHRLQTAAYAECIEWRTPPERCGVHLAADGTYTVHRHDNPNDRRVWLAALAVANWKFNKGR